MHSSPHDYELRAAASTFQARTRQLADLEIMRRPERWPRHPFLCLRQESVFIDGLPRLGLLVDSPRLFGSDAYRFTLFEVNLYEIPRYGGSLTDQQFLQRARRTYKSFEQILDDGWVVD